MICKPPSMRFARESDDYRHEGGRVCHNKPVPADHLDSARTANPVAQQRKRLDTALAKTSNAIAGMIEAFGEQLITIDELRARMPDLRARETNLRNQIEVLDKQLADRETYLKLASDLEGFLTQLHIKAELSTVNERQRVLRLLVKDVLIGPDKITIRHRMPIRGRATDNAKPTTDAGTEDDHAGHCPLHWVSATVPWGAPDPGVISPGR
jgi:site-specific DNA recombinase